MSLLENAYALLIGIAYEDGLDTRGDAEDLAAILTDESLCGYPEKNVTLLIGEQADRAGILKAFDALIATTDEHSSVFLYYSGHGDVLDGVFHFVPHGIVEGMTYEAYTGAWVTAEDLRSKIDRLATRRLIFFMDCCHATGIAAGGFSPKMKAGAAAAASERDSFEKLEGLAQKVDTEKGISIVASCKEEQESYQLEGDKNSLFTKHLLMALKGEHQKEFQDPFVRILEVAGYLLRVVPETIESVARDCDPPLDIRQEPYVNLEMYDNFILSYVPKALRQKIAGAESPPDPQKQAAPADKKPQWVFRETEGANNLILFIHGFTGEGSGTFENLPDLLMADPELDGWDMKPFGYSQFIQPEHGKHVWGGIKDIGRIVDYLCTSIRYKFEKYDRIAIIAHGLGGLIAQRALLDFGKEYQRKISHLVLLACPSNGIPPEELQTGWNAEYAEIGSDAPFIRSLRGDWAQAYPKGYPFRLAAVAASDDPFVTTESCFEAFPSEHCSLIPGNHFSIAKPEDTDSESYVLVRDCLTRSEFFRDFGDPRERNLALGKYEAVAQELLPEKDALDPHRLKQLAFALEGLDRRDEVMELLESHPAAGKSSDLMGIIGGRYKRAYLKKPSKKDGEAAQVYYSLALEQAQANAEPEQIYYHSINLAFLALVCEGDKPGMRKYAQMAIDAAGASPDSLWKTATLGEAQLYMGDLEKAQEYYRQAAREAGTRQKISMHLNASAAYARLRDTEGRTDAPFLVFLKETLLT